MNRILVVEDDPDTASLVKYILEDEGWVVMEADSVAAAMAKLEVEAVDLILIDRKLPDQDGLELCRQMRQREAFADIPVLFITAKKTVADIVEGLDAGADDYLVKPFSLVELLARARALLRRAQRYTRIVPIPNTGSLEF